MSKFENKTRTFGETKLVKTMRIYEDEWKAAKRIHPNFSAFARRAVLEKIERKNENLILRGLLVRANTELSKLTHWLQVPDKDGNLVDATSHFQIKLDIGYALHQKNNSQG